MIRAFLSHSSKDKESYVKHIAKWLGKDNVIYDEFTFEEGEKNLNEILRGLSKTELFVLLISENSLESAWVKREICEAQLKLESGDIQKIYPIIIDDNITYLDKRIPAWMSSEYNLKPIKRARVIANRIHHKLRELSWSKHPQLEKKQKLFVGRNDKQEEFEERVHDFGVKKPNVIIASGLSGVGRRTFLRNALSKTNIIDITYSPSTIYLDRNVSIEDFILKLNDLGLVDLDRDVLALNDKSIMQKINLIKEIMLEAYSSREIIFILDDGCLVNYKREITPWFFDLIDTFDNFSYPVFCCASRYNVKFSNRPRDGKFYFVELSELNPNERKRLFNQMLEIENINLEKNDFDSISQLLSGLPDQVTYAVDSINNDPMTKLSDKMIMIAQYNSDRAALLLQKFDGNDDVLDFIRLLAQFEIITVDFIFSIVSEDKYFSILEELSSENICELLGINGEMIRLNDIIRDYIKRNRLSLRQDYNEKIKETVSNLIVREDLFERDSSEYIFSIKESLKAGKTINEDFLIPSHYLRCMKDLYYEKGQLDRIIELADIILQKESNIDFNVLQDIRYYLCLALAKKRNSRMLQEVQKIQGDEHAFLLGFYYRQSGRLQEALEKFKSIVNAKYVDARAKREMVQVYVQLEDYDAALDYAKNNYEENLGNQFHTQAYFNCLINSKNVLSHKEILLKIIKNLRAIASDQSNEMADIAEALYTAKIENNKTASIDKINDCIAKYPENHYPLMAKCDIALKYRDPITLSEAVDLLDVLIKRKHLSQRTLTKYKAFLAALNGDVTKALSLLKTDLSRYPTENKDKMVSMLHDFSKSAN